MAQAPDSIDVVFDPGWTGTTFSEPLAETIWRGFSPVVKQVAIREISLGAHVLSIQFDRVSEKSLICFEGPPRSELPNEAEKNYSLQRGNYCYDDTLMTITDMENMCYIAFKNPSYEHEEFLQGSLGYLQEFVRTYIVRAKPW